MSPGEPQGCSKPPQAPTFDDFRDSFDVDEEFMKTFLDYAQEENEDLEFNEEQYEISKALLKLRMKAKIASDLWGYSEFYQIYNESNEILQKAIEIIESDTYDKSGLSIVD